MKKILINYLSGLALLALLLSACSSEQSSASKVPEASTFQHNVKAMGTIMAPASEVWNTISAFSEPEQYMAPMVAQSSTEGSGIGMTRQLTTGDGGKITEKLSALDGEQMSLTYAATEAALQMAAYQATMRVKDLGNGNCQLFWEGAFNLAAEGNEGQVKATLRDVYNNGIFGLKKMHTAATTEVGIINKPAEEVWEIISSFDAPERYIALIETSKAQGKGKGARRFCVTTEGNEFSEQVLELDSKTMFLKYEGLDSDWPMAGYEAIMQVKALSDEQCELSWTAVYKPRVPAAEMDAIISGMFKMGIEGLGEDVKPSDSPTPTAPTTTSAPPAQASPLFPCATDSPPPYHRY